VDNKCNTYRIGEIAEKLGLSPRSIRYYEEVGILRPTRSDGGFRLYSERDINTIRMVLRFKDLGLALDEIRALLGPREGPADAKTIATLKDALLLRKKEFEERIEKYREGIEQIDIVIDQLSRCGHCGMAMEKETCHNCISQDGEDYSPLLEGLF
jgi:DNA-binding transcriptional MerR regulator